MFRPSVADLRVEPEPAPPAAGLESEAALDAYDIEWRAWARDLELKVGRLCRDAVRQGVKLPFSCPKP